MFFRIKRKIKKGKGKKLRRKNLLHRGKEVHNGEEAFVEVKRLARAKLSFAFAKEALSEDNPRVCQGEEAFTEANDGGLDQKTTTFEPIFDLFSTLINICI